MEQNYSKEYVNKLELGLMRALDRLSLVCDNFDYYDEMCDLTEMTNSEVLDFLDKFGGCE